MALNRHPRHKGLRYIIPLGSLVALALFVGVYFYGRHDGGAAEDAKWQVAQSEAVANAQKSARDNLSSQLALWGDALNKLGEEKLKSDATLAQARAEAALVTAGKNCSLGPEAVHALNVARTGGLE